MAVPLIAAGAMAAVSFIGPMFVHSLFSIIISSSPLAEQFRQTLNPRWPIQMPMPADLVHLRLLGTIDASTYDGMMLKHGFTAEQGANLLAGAERLLTGAELVFANFRGIIDDSTYTEQMRRQGYTEESLTTFKEVSRFFPGAADLVQFAVREVYTPSVREEYQLDADLPDVFLQEAAKAGVPDEQARNYWASHWILPSVQMGYEMLHRGVINEEQLRTLLKTQDVMPFWREPLIAISYQPLTRVDVRRMYRLGVLDEAGVLKSYKVLGYNDEDAQRMTDFTIAYETEEEKSLSVTEILKAFERKVLTRQEAKDWIMDCGYNDAIAEIKITVKEVDLIQRETDERLDMLIEQFVGGLITQSQLEDELGLMELPAEQANHIVWKAQRKKQGAIKMPSIADVRNWIDAGQITRDDGIAILENLNIPSEYVPFYLGERKRMPSISDVRRWYADDVIDETQATSILTELNVPPEFINFYLVEKVKLPSTGDIRRWKETGLIDDARATELLALLRVPEEFIPLYLDEKDREPSIKDIQYWHSEGFIDEAKAKKLLAQAGIAADLFDFYLKEKMRVPTIKDIQKWLEQAFIDPGRAEQLLRSIGVREEFIVLYLREVEAKIEATE